MSVLEASQFLSPHLCRLLNWFFFKLLQQASILCQTHKTSKSQWIGLEWIWRNRCYVFVFSQLFPITYGTMELLRHSVKVEEGEQLFLFTIIIELHNFRMTRSAWELKQIFIARNHVKSVKTRRRLRRIVLNCKEQGQRQKKITRMVEDQRFFLLELKYSHSKI